jgi:Bardet-Biedl syndrome 5 protein
MLDCSLNSLSMIPGEAIISSTLEVQDLRSNFTGIKANINSPGSLSCTNLRLIFLSSSTELDTSSSLPLSSIVSLTIPTPSLLCVVTSLDTFQFLGDGIDSFLGSLNSILKSYNASSLHRKLHIRSSLLFNPKTPSLAILDKESITLKIEGVCNIACDQGTIGLLVITNLRVVWISNHDRLFNVSIPYNTTNQILVQKSRYGLALCIEADDLRLGQLHNANF